MEDALVLVEDQLHDLVLEDHEHGDVGRLGFGSEQRGAEDDSHVLHRHTIVVAVANHPVGERARSSDGRGNGKWTLAAALTCVGGRREASWCRGWEQEVTSPARRCRTAWSCTQEFLRREAKGQRRPCQTWKEMELQQESLTDGCDEPVEVAVGEERLRQFPEEQLEGAGDDVHIFPLAVLQVQFLCAETQ